MAGVFGSNSGNMLLGLAAVQRQTGKRMDHPAIMAALDRYIQDFHPGALYMHSDDHSLEHFAHDLHVEPEEAVELLKKPGKRRGEVLQKVQDPRNVGCGHLSLMMGNVKEYPACHPSSCRTSSAHSSS